MPQQDPLHLLAIEPRFPGRLAAVADWLVERRGYRVHLFCHHVEPREDGGWPATLGRGLDVVQFQVGGVAREPAVAWTRSLERGLCYAYGAWEVFDSRRIRPVDLILGRSAALGSTLFAPVTYPGTPIANLFDYYVHPQAHDLWADDGPTLPDEYLHWRRAANAMDLLDLENGVIPWTLTGWQRDLYPPEYRDDFHVLHDGVDADLYARARDPSGAGGGRSRTLLGRAIPAGTKVVTYVARTLDRLRGFDRFLDLANRLLRDRTDVICVALGGGPVERMLDIPHHGRDYGAGLLETIPPVDPARFWTPGRVAPGEVVEVLAASDLHVVPGRPYPIARSLLEAMAAGAPILAWDTPPVRELLDPDRNALLVPSGDPEAAHAAALRVLDDPAAFFPLTQAARTTIRERFDREFTLPALATAFSTWAARPTKLS